MKKVLLLVVVESKEDLTVDQYQKFLERSFWGTRTFTESTAKFDVVDADQFGGEKPSSDVQDEIETLGYKARRLIGE